MDHAPAISGQATGRLREKFRGRRGIRRWLFTGLGRDRPEARARRVILLVVFIWIVGLSDLCFTLLAQQTEGFSERNPVAARIVHAGSVLVAFKLGSLLLASIILLRFRRHWFTELSCWVMSFIHTALALIWSSYYNWLD